MQISCGVYSAVPPQGVVRATTDTLFHAAEVRQIARYHPGDLVRHIGEGGLEIALHPRIPGRYGQFFVASTLMDVCPPLDSLKSKP